MLRSKKHNSVNLETNFHPDQLKQDFLLLRKSLEEGHAGLYRHRQKKDVDEKFNETLSRLNNPITLLDFYKQLESLIDFIADGHTSVMLDKNLISHIKDNIGIFPIKPIIIENRIYVHKNISENKNLILGTEILSINKNPIKKILQDISTFFHIDGFGDGRKTKSIERNFRYIFSVYEGLNDIFDVEYRDQRDEKIKNVQLKAVKTKDTKKHVVMRDSTNVHDSLYSLNLIDDSKIAVLKIRAFMQQKKEMKYSDFLENSFAILKEDNIEYLILDLRGNRGGNDAFGALLYSYLAFEEFQYYEGLYLNKIKFEFLKETGNRLFNVMLRIIRKEQAEVGFKIFNPFFMPKLYLTHEIQKNAFKGKVFCLIDGGTFSAACEFATTCHRFKRVVFVGEETRGGYIGNTSGPMVNLSLPNTKLIVRIPLFRYVMPVSQEGNHRGIIPDHEIKPTLEDIINEEDTILNFIIENLDSM